jgi:hypothetical protein
MAETETEIGSPEGPGLVSVSVHAYFELAIEAMNSILRLITIQNDLKVLFNLKCDNHYKQNLNSGIIIS